MNTAHKINYAIIMMLWYNNQVQLLLQLSTSTQMMTSMMFHVMRLVVLLLFMEMVEDLNAHQWKKYFW